MGYDLFFVNHTKKQIVGSKNVFGGFEDGKQLSAYLSMCQGCTFEILGEDSGFIERNVYSSAAPDGYKHIELYQYKIGNCYSSDPNEVETTGKEILRLVDAVNESEQD